MTPTATPPDDDRFDACLDAELLASYLEGRTSPAERATVEAHLAHCEDCQFVFAETIHAQREVPDVNTRDRRRWILGGATVAAAAAGLVVAVALGTTYRSTAPTTTLTVALNELDSSSGPYRRVEPRVTVLPTHRDLQPAMRSADPSSDASPALREAAAIVEKAASETTSTEGRHALGAMYLAEGQAARAAETLAPLAPNTKDAGVLTDIAAALLARGADGDAKQAITLLTRAVAIEPTRAEAWFNLGLAAEAVADLSRARDAWTRYLALDPSSEWTAEARRHLEKLNR